MTPQEAIQFLKETIAGCHFLRDRQLKAVCEVSINALEKQIPKRINEYNRCPCCDTYNETIEKRKNTVTYDICYCWHCGQALDWSDTE